MHQSENWADRLPAGFEGLKTRLSQAAQTRPAGFYHLFINGQLLGRLHGELGEIVRQQSTAWTSQWNAQRCELYWNLPLDTLVSALTDLGRWLADQGWVPNWRGETQTLFDRNGVAIGELERALFKVFGLRSQAVHLHVETGEGLIWVGVRADSKKEHPGLLDNLCAGGVSSGETPQGAAWRELFEEAGLDSTHLRGACLTPLGGVEVSRAQGNGWHLEQCHLYFATMREGVHPHNQDGEVCGFQLMTPMACAQAVNQNRFTPDAGLCCALAMRRAHAV
ncbi:NUDIX hydrolase [Limnobacter litoralis]|uniref:Nudix hydrolase domain-containing protein n=1 Tax=Limnobacter litoralis TaxID=481366 RepID=A0ABQ5YPY5_9BURK|nr:NUDIX domain-containing protein [Limnobacter litoralis]GLR25507.1 hypothetical protein GCM10007875_05950 [Limnobacter litoralis]